MFTFTYSRNAIAVDLVEWGVIPGIAAQSIVISMTHCNLSRSYRAIHSCRISILSMGWILTGLEASVLWRTGGTTCCSRSTWLRHFLPGQLLLLLLLHWRHDGYLRGIGTPRTGHLRGAEILVVRIHGGKASLIHGVESCCLPLNVPLVTDNCVATRTALRIPAGVLTRFSPISWLLCSPHSFSRTLSLCALIADCLTGGYPLKTVQAMLRCKSCWAERSSHDWFIVIKANIAWTLIYMSISFIIFLFIGSWERLGDSD